MNWFIRKVSLKLQYLGVIAYNILQGESYPNDKPSTISYTVDIPVSSRGKPTPTTVILYANSVDATAPIHLNNHTKEIATLELDISMVSNEDKKEVGKTWIGWHRYHEVSGVVEARYNSAMIQYTAKLKGKRGVLDAVC